jgi:hypothetical protein
MIFFKGLRLRQRFALLTAIVLTTLLSVFCYTIYRTQEAKILRSNEERMLSHLEDVATLFDLTLKEKQGEIDHAISVASYFLGHSDSIVVTDTRFPVKTVNINTKDTVEQELNEWYVQGALLHRNMELLNRIQDLTGISVSFYQKSENGYLSMASTFGEGGLSYLIPYDSAMVRSTERGLRHFGRHSFAGDTYTSFFAPINMRNNVIGVMQLAYNHRKDLIALREKLSEKKYFTSGYPFAFDKEGKVLFHPIRSGQNVSDDDFFRTMLQNGKGKVFSMENGRLMIMYFNYYEPLDIFLVCAVPELELVEAPLKQLRFVIFVGFFVTLLLMILVINYLMKEVSDDIKVMVNALQELAMGRYPKAQVRNKDEIGDMSRSLNVVINALQDAATFAENVGTNKFDTRFEPLSEDDRLGNALVSMRNNLKRIADEDKQRNWANEGYAKFAELLRQQYESFEQLGSVLIEEIVNYVGANQGGIMIVSGEKEEEQLELIAHYAWNRKRYRKKTISKGEGLVGQAWQERDKVFLSEIPSDYVAVTSGLGDVTPNCILIVPLKFNQEIYGMLEIASFHLLSNFEIDFVEKLGEIIGSTISMFKYNEKTKHLLAETQEKSQQMQSQEEEMRQNLEEMQATQEEFHRKELDYIRRIAELEKILSIQEKLSHQG